MGLAGKQTSGTLIPSSLSELATAKAWGRDPDQWEALSDDARAVMQAYEAVTARIDAAEWYVRERQKG